VGRENLKHAGKGKRKLSFIESSRYCLALFYCLINNKRMLYAK
jgi:hypothetical protein